jgi:hypothetical protein
MVAVYKSSVLASSAAIITYTAIEAYFLTFAAV